MLVPSLKTTDLSGSTVTPPKLLTALWLAPLGRKNVTVVTVCWFPLTCVCAYMTYARALEWNTTTVTTVTFGPDRLRPFQRLDPSLTSAAGG